MNDSLSSPTKPRLASSDGAELVALLGAIAAGDRGAMANLYRRTSARLYGICLRLLGSEAEAQDILQEVFVTVWRKAESFDAAKAGGMTWLSVLARNRAIDRLRQRRPGHDDLDSAGDVVDESPSAFDLVARDEENDRLADCLAELDEQPRALNRRAFIDGATYRQLAEDGDVPLGTMKSWMRRALQRLRGCLEQ